MKTSVLNHLTKCVSCGSYFYQFKRGDVESRCESCWEDPPDKPEVNKELLSRWQEGDITL